MSQDNIVNSLCDLQIKKSIAFDFDGTIVNCEIRQVEVLRSILRRGNVNMKNFDFKKWWELKTNGSSTYDALIKMQIPEKTAVNIRNNWLDIIENPEWLDLDSLKRNATELFKELNKLNKSIFIITARKSKHLFHNQIKKLSLDDLISASFVVNPYNSKEEKKEILNLLKPSFFVGDTEVDYYSSMESKINFIGITDGQRSKQFLLNIGVRNIIEKLY